MSQEMNIARMVTALCLKDLANPDLMVDKASDSLTFPSASCQGEVHMHVTAAPAN
jgi:hypothetical protein